MVLKPAEEASLTPLRLEILARAARPAGGLLQVVTGYGEEAGAALVAHPGVDHLSFVGSPAVGSAIAAGGGAAAGRRSRWSLAGSRRTWCLRTPIWRRRCL